MALYGLCSARRVMLMDLKAKKVLIFTIAGLTGLPGLYSLFRNPRGIFIYIKWFFTGEIPNHLMPLWVVVLSLLAIAVYFLRPISAYGLVRFKTWGKDLAIVTLGLDFVIRFIGFVNLWTYHDRHPEALKSFEEMKRSLATPQQGDLTPVVQKISVIPSYIMAAISLILIIILLKIDYRSFEA